MKYKLIMENWRRYQNNIDNRLVFEGKRLDSDRLIEMVIANEITAMDYLNSLDEHVTQQIQMHVNSLNEGIFTDGFKRIAMKVANVGLSALEKIKNFLNKIDLNTGVAVYKIITKCLGIVKKVMVALKKFSDAIGPIGRVLVVAAVMTILSGAAWAANSQGMTVPEDILQVAAEILSDMAQEGASSEISNVQVLGDTEVYDNGRELANAVDKFRVSVGNENNSTDKAINSIREIIFQLNRDEPMTQEMWSEWLGKVDQETALLIEDAIRDAEKMKQNDPETFEEMKKLGEKIRIFTDEKSKFAEITDVNISSDKGGGDTFNMTRTVAKSASTFKDRIGHTN